MITMFKALLQFVFLERVEKSERVCLAMFCQFIFCCLCPVGDIFLQFLFQRCNKFVCRPPPKYLATIQSR